LSTNPAMLRVQEGEVCEGLWQIIEADGIYNSTCTIKGPSKVADTLKDEEDTQGQAKYTHTKRPHHTSSPKPLGYKEDVQGQRNQHTEKHTKEESQLDTYRDKGTNRTYKTENRINYFKRTNNGAKLFKSYAHNKLEMTIQQNPVQQH